MKRRGDLFSEGRKVLPHSIERQLGPEILRRTAPEDSLRCNGNLLCLHGLPEHGIGARSAHVAQALDAAGALAPRGVRQGVRLRLTRSPVKNSVAAFRKEIPTAYPKSVGTDDFFKALNCYR